MNDQEQVSKLQSLLARIQRNAAVPRSRAPLPPPAAFAPTPELPAAPPPVAAAPAPAAYVPPAPAYIPPAPSFDEQSIDELLGVSEAPPPLDVDIPLDTLPPQADVGAPAPPPEAEPIPLVSVATHEPVPSPEPFDADFSLDSEVSEVRVATAPRDSGPEVTVAAIEAEAEPIIAEELSEEDLVEVTEGTPLPASDLDIDFEEEAERPPASSQRQVAASRDEALAAAAHVELEREVPLKTPPPESGPQEAPAPVLAAPAAPDVDALLGDELEIPTRGAPAAVPTPEQLGQTIDLEEAAGPSLELAEPARSTTRPAPSEELEVALPGREVAGGYDDRLMPPPEARDELEAHRRRLEEDIAPPPESLATLPSMQPGPAPELVPVVAAPIVELLPLEASPVAAEGATTPEVLVRAAPEGVAETFASVREPFRPSTFVELLDASISLG
jgi:hypothetical protein